jgi:DNA-binding NtrC family response regulator
LVSAARVLIVDDEPLVLEVLSELLEDEGLTVVTAESAEKAWPLIEASRFDLLVTDKNLPGESGIELLARVQASGISLPSVLITGYASVESVTEALRYGAVDYISKPFPNVNHVLLRLQSVLDRRTNGLLTQRIISDMTTMVELGAMDVPTLTRIRQQLFGFREALNDRQQFLLVDEPDSQLWKVVRTASAARHLGIAIVSNHEDAIDLARRPDGPVAAVVDADGADATTLVRGLRAADPMMEVLGVAIASDLQAALACVDAGASDFALPMSEGSLPFAARLERLMGRSRRRRLFVHLMTTLYLHVLGVADGLADAVLELVSPSDRELVKARADAAGEVEITETDEHDVEMAEYLEGLGVRGDVLGTDPLLVGGD